VKLSIVTNAYNQGKFLRRCLESVLSQSYQDFEYIVIDPGSTDETADILTEYEIRGDRRLTILREKDNGPADGLNKGFARANGEWFAYLNADDFFLKDALADAIMAIGQHPTADCIYADGYMTDASGRAVRRVISLPYTARRAVLGRTLFLQQSTFWKAASFRQVGGFNVENQTSWDAELLLEMSLAGMELRHVSGYWGAFVIHPESITGSQRHAALSKTNHERMFRRVMGRSSTPTDTNMRKFYRYLDMIIRPRIMAIKIIDASGMVKLPKIS
jgi:glycosyltransferase involved in cell wall biosynthesis